MRKHEKVKVYYSDATYTLIIASAVYQNATHTPVHFSFKI